MKIGLLLGSFDPITIGHVAIANILITNNVVDKVVFVVAKQNPWKTQQSADFDLRVKMCSLATQSLGSRCVISALESTIDGEPYSYKVLDKIRAENEKDKLYIVCGTDVIEEIFYWKNFASHIFPYFNFIEICRTSLPCGMGLKQLCVIAKGKREFGECGTKETIFILPRTMDISSTIVRQLVKEGKEPYPYVTESVSEIIKQNNLYK